jgi:Homeodomain-like domain
MRDPDEISRVLSLVEAGKNDCEIARVTGIPRSTILDWRHGRVPRPGVSHWRL